MTATETEDAFMWLGRTYEVAKDMLEDGNMDLFCSFLDDIAEDALTLRNSIRPKVSQ